MLSPSDLRPSTFPFRYLLAWAGISLVSMLWVPVAASVPGSEVAQLFAEGVISAPGSFGTAFAPDGKTLYFCHMTRTGSTWRSTLMVSQLNGDGWDAPHPVSFSGEFNDFDPFVSPDGTHLYFSAVRPETGQSPALWVAEKTADGWSAPRSMVSITGAGGAAVFPSVAANGNLYFAGQNPGLLSLGSDDIYVCRKLHDGTYGAPENLGPAVNSASQDYDAYVASDESFLVFASRRPGGIGGSDFYICERRDGTWTPARNLGPSINSADSAGISCPAVSRDGAWFFFSMTGRAGKSGIFRIGIEALGLARPTPASAKP